MAVVGSTLTLGPTPDSVHASPSSYSGRATVVDATVLGTNTVLVDTGPLPPAGGELTAYDLTANVPTLLDAEALGATASGQGFRSRSTASIANVDLSVLGNDIEADLISSTANAECTAAGPAATTGMEILGLRVNGVDTTVTGEANQTIPITGGSLIVNERTESTTSDSADATIFAIHVIITSGGLADVKIAVADAGIVCSPPTGDGFTYGGRGTGLNVDLLGVETTVTDTGELPPEGGSLHASTVGANVPGLISTGVLEASSSGQDGTAESRASVAAVDLGALGQTVDADVVRSVAKATCNAGTPSVIGGSEVVNLVINGLAIAATGQPNQTITLPLGLGQVVINEQTSNVTSTTGEITVHALHITLVGLAEVFLATSRAYIECPPPTTPTATPTATLVPTNTSTSVPGPSATPGSCSLPVHQQTVSGGSTGSSTVTSAGLSAGSSGDVYLASISTKPNVAATSVSGLGLTWSLVKSQCAARSQTRTEVWKAQGAGAGGTVAATLASAPTNAVITVSRYSGSAGVGSFVAANTLGVNGACSGGTDANTYSVNLTTTSDNSLAFGGVALRHRTHTPGASYIERAERMQGSGGDAAGIAAEDRSVATGGTVAVNGTLSGAVDWAVVGVEILCGGAPAPTATPGSSPTSTNQPSATSTPQPTATSTSQPTATRTSTATPSATPGTTALCKLYAVHDESGNDSQYFHIDLESLQVTAIGPLHSDSDLEGLDIHPTTNVLYATAGSANQHGEDGYLYTVDAADGELTIIGDTGFSEVIALSFRPTDNTLWGWSEGAGIIVINADTAAATLVFNSTLEGDGMAWDSAGELLYVADHQKLYVYDPTDQTLTLHATNLPGETEALETRPDNDLWGGLHKSGAVSIYVYDPVAKQTDSSDDIATQYNDVEGIAWPDECELP